MAMSAGASVIATTMAVSTVRASAGPNARSGPTLATVSEAAPPATTRPAVRIMGVNSAVVRRAACARGSPSASRERMPARSTGANGEMVCGR
jgi:hypothetical protein